MPETVTKQELQDLLAEPVDRASYESVVQAIYSSFKSVDQAHDCAGELAGQVERASEEEQRDLHERIGILRFAVGDYGRAREHLEQVKSRKEAAHFLGRVYAELGLADDAIASLEAGRRGEDDFITDVMLVDLLCGQRRPEEARNICKRTRKGRERDCDWLYAMGRVLEAEGAYDKAMEHYEQVLAQNPDHRQSLFRMALNCDLNGEDERALEFYQRCASLKPTFAAALINLGVMHEDSGRFEPAIDCYKRVLATDPRHERARLFLKDAEASQNMMVDEEKRRSVRARDEVLQLPVSNFELSARCRHVLDRLNIFTLGDLADCNEDALLQFKNFGETSLQEIKDLMARNSLQIGQPLQPRVELLGPGGDEPVDEAAQEKFSMPIDFLGLSTRSRKCMERLNISSVGELIDRTAEDLLSTPNFGRTSVAEIKGKLGELDLALREE